MSHVRSAMGVSGKGFGFERGRGRNLNNELLYWPPCIPPCQTSAQYIVARTPAFGGIVRPKSPGLTTGKPLVRRRLKEDLIGSDICVHDRFPAGCLTCIAGGCFHV
jgi:hypothetical protein